jgi:formylglycine-generating enzyme required for sulfatase activity
MKTLIVQPNAEMAEWMSQVVAAVAGGETQIVSSPEEGELALGDTDITFILTEAHFENADGLGWLNKVKSTVPATRTAVVSVFDLSGWLDHFGETPYIGLPQDHEKLSAFLASPPPELAAPAPEEPTSEVTAPEPQATPPTPAPVFTASPKEEAPAAAVETIPSTKPATTPSIATKPVVKPAATLPTRASAAAPAGVGLIRKGVPPGNMAASLPRRVGPSNLPPGVASKVAGAGGQVVVSDKTIVSSPSQIAKIEQEGGNTDATVQPQAGISDRTIISSASQIAQIEKQGVQAAQIAKATPRTSASINLPQRPKSLVAKKDPPAWVVMLKLDKLQPWQWITMGLSVVAIILGWFGWWLWTNYYSEPPMTEFLGVVAIPAGEYAYGEGEKATKVQVNAFWIDEYEVTIGQYKRFLEAVAGKEKSFAPPGMPATKKSFAPDNWDALVEAVRRRKQFHGAQLTYDHPVINVDLYDALAYAKWAGKRIPTEQEWEVAARYPNGWLYPWTEKFDPNTDDRGRANLGLDYAPNKPSDGAKVDGFNGPNPVNMKNSDSTPAGLKGTFGNVREWTSSKGGGLLQGSEAPIICGGSFMTKVDFKLTTRNKRMGITDETRKEDIGFRCVSDKPPPAPAK